MRAARSPTSCAAGREGAGGGAGVRGQPRRWAGAGRRVRRSGPGHPVPPGFIDEILDAPDPAVAGIDAAVRLAEELLDVPGVRGVDLGAVPVKGSEDATTRALATVGRALSGG